MGEGDNNSSDKVVNKDACNKCREDIMHQLVGLWGKTDSFSDALTELKIISSRQLVLQEQSCKMLEKLEQKHDRYEEYIEAQLDKIQEKFDEKTKIRENEDRVWKQAWFKYIVLTACVVSVALVGSAIGLNLIDKWGLIIK